MSTAHDALTRQLLEWIAQSPHTYSETMDAWKSSCPRLAIWEDACADGLVDCEPTLSGRVFLTEKGKSLLRAG